MTRTVTVWFTRCVSPLRTVSCHNAVSGSHQVSFNDILMTRLAQTLGTRRERPLPSWLLAINSELFMAACLFFGGFVLSFFAHWDFGRWLVALILVAPVFGLPAMQFAATFRGHRLSAELLCFFLPCVAALPALMAAVAVAIPLSESVPLSAERLLRDAFPFACIAAWIFFMASLNFYWRKELAAAAIPTTSADEASSQAIVSDSSASGRNYRMTLRELLAFVTGICLVLGGIVFGVRDVPPQSAFHATPAGARVDLPMGASDVCVIRGSRNSIAYNFSIDEHGFREWATAQAGVSDSKAAKVSIVPITNGLTIYPVLFTIRCGFVAGVFPCGGRAAGSWASRTAP